MPSDKNMHSLYAIYSKYSNIVCNSCISKLCSLFSNKRFMLNEIFLQTLDNTSQSALLQTASTNWPKVWHGFQNLFEIWKLLKFFYDLLRLFPIHTVLPHIFEKKVIMLLSIWFVNVPTIWQGLKGSLIHKYFVKWGRVGLLLVLKVCIKVCISWEGHSLPLRMPLFLFTIKGWFTDPWYLVLTFTQQSTTK